MMDIHVVYLDIRRRYCMALFIRDDEVDALATELQKATRAATKKEAVRIALKNELTRTKRRNRFDARFLRAMALADAMGPSDPNFDMKRFTDEMWGDN
jgi:antitoxin VapB